jgi:hypothetical protein
MRIGIMMVAIFALGSAASAEAPDRPTAILVSPIHEAQVVRGDDGMDHVEYELFVVNVFSEPVTLSSVTVLDPVGMELMRIEGGARRAPDSLHEDSDARRSRTVGRLGRCRSDPSAGHRAGTGHAPDRLHPQGGLGACSDGRQPGG